MELTIVGEIKFKNCVLAVYGDLMHRSSGLRMWPT